MRTLAALLAACCTLAITIPAALAAERPLAPVTYTDPVDAPVIDAFSAPPSPYAAGNRGLDYATAAETVVHAAGQGEVTFAGQVAGALHVVVLHPDGIRTSYSFLRSVSVRRGQRVSAGTPLGVTAGALHFGARAGDAYVDPAVLLSGGPPHVHLVPVEAWGPQSERRERSWLASALAGVRQLPGLALSASGDAVAWARDAGAETLTGVVDYLEFELDTRLAQLSLLIHYAHAFDPAYLSVGGIRAFLEWWHRDCTGDDVAIPPPAERRILVLVGGFGSASADASVLDVDPASLGYADSDVALFSYRGGRVPGVGSLAGIPTSDYGEADAQGDLREAGRRLRTLLEDIRVAHPGVPVDIVAHSQGGVVARVALGDGSRFDPTRPEIGNLITLGSPHQGADLATGVQAVNTTAAGHTALAIGEVLTGLDAESAAARQLSEASGFFSDLRDQDLPADVKVTSIAARGDWTVTGRRSLLEGATNVLVPIDGLGAHGGLSGSPEVHREIALALAGLPPGCQSIADLVLGTVRSTAIGVVEDGMGLGLAAASLRLDVRMGPRPPGPIPTVGRSD